MEKKYQKGAWVILSILDIKEIKKQKLAYILFTIFCIVFACIYEYFSHGVISYFMILAFLIPLFFGVLITYLISSKSKKLPSKLENNLYNSAIVTLTIGSIIEGVLQIYGTTNFKVYAYLIVGILFLLISTILYLVRKK